MPVRIGQVVSLAVASLAAASAAAGGAAAVDGARNPAGPAGTGVRGPEALPLEAWDAARSIASGRHRAERDERIRRLAEEVFAASKEKASRALEQGGRGQAKKARQASRPGGPVWIFVSRSLGEQALREILEVSARTGAAVVFRGIPKGTKLPQGFHDLYAMARDMEPKPNVMLDPVLWRKWKIDVAPTLAVGRRGAAAPVALVRGLTNPDWIRRRVAGGARGDLGRHGPTAEPSEPDLIEVIKAKVLAYDWRAAKERAVKRYWRRVPMIELPAATEPRTRTISLAVRVQEDITDANGQVIVREGEIIDPMEQRPFTLRLLVFDATRPEQVAWAAKTYAGARDVLIATRMDREEGWKGLRRVQEKVGGPVYLLTADVRSRFRIERVPTIVRAATDGRRVLIEEQVPGRSRKSDSRRLAADRGNTQ